MIICDLWAENQVHYEFNKNILKLICKIEQKKIKYFGEEEQVENLETQNFEEIEFNIINVKINNKLEKIKHYFSNLKKINNENNKKIIILTGLPILVLLGKFIFKNKEVYIFLHSLDQIKLKKCKYNLFKIAIKILFFSKFKYIVLGENIRENLIKLVPEIKDKVFSIDHPYSFNKNNINKKFNGKVRISTCGIITYEKGLNNIYEFIDKIGNNFEFKHIGKSMEEIQEGYLKYFPYKKELVSQEIYENLIDELDYILILYPINSYKLTASGVYFDCIKYNKPLLGLRNEYFEYMFKKYGAIGKLFDTVDEIIEYLKNDRKILEEEQHIFWKNMKDIRKILNENVEKDLKKIIYQGVE